MLEWKQLLNPVRRKALNGNSESMNTGVGRQELERDYDRILFCTPTRRLAEKTQVFPMEENTATRNRLTHSHEVSNLARSIGVRIAFDHPGDVFGDEHENYIKGIMGLLWSAIRKSSQEKDAYERYAYGKISENYRRVYEGSERTEYDSGHLLCDAVSGMTEPYLIKTYHELRSLSDGPT